MKNYQKSFIGMTAAVMKKSFIGMTAAVMILVCALAYSEYKTTHYQRGVRAYVMAAYGNGAISLEECRELTKDASDESITSRMRYRKARQVRHMVDRAYEKQRERELRNTEPGCYAGFKR